MKKIYKRTGLQMVFAIAFLWPIFLILSNFFVHGEQSLSQIRELGTGKYHFMLYMGNTLFYSITIAGLGCLLSLPVGYVFAKINFRGRDFLFYIFVLVMMMPFQAMALPNHIVIRDLGLLDKRLGMILPSIFSPLPVILLRQRFKSIPQAQIDAFSLESKSVLALFRYIVLPECITTIGTVFLLLFSITYNAWEEPLLFLPHNQELMPLAEVISGISEKVRTAVEVCYLVPIVIIYILFGAQIRETFERIVNI